MDPTALQRQKRRINRLRAAGVGRTTLFVHDENKAALDAMRPYFIAAGNAELLTSLVAQLAAQTTTASTAKGPQYGVFRYPGGKSWLIPEIKSWLASSLRPNIFIEPFAGGAIVGLTVAAEGLANNIFLSEIDENIVAVWKTIFSERPADSDWLCERIKNFVVTPDNVSKAIAAKSQSLRERAFRTIVRNRMGRGGVMAPGAGLLKNGENGKGLSSRWYPETLIDRINVLRGLRSRITIERADALDVIKRFANDAEAYFFIDPPYTAGGRNSGHRLYKYSHLDHLALFALVVTVKGSAIMTYDDVPEARKMALDHGFQIKEVVMKTTHHRVIRELLITKP